GKRFRQPFERVEGSRLFLPSNPIVSNQLPQPLSGPTPFQLGRFLVDSGSPVSLIPALDDVTAAPSVDTGLRCASGTAIRAFGTERINVPINGRMIPFTATKANVVRPILGRDFFAGPGKDYVIDIGARKLLNKSNGLCDDLFFEDGVKSKVVGALYNRDHLNPFASPFLPSFQLENCKRLSASLIQTFCDKMGPDDGNSPSLFSPIRIDTGSHPPIFSKYRPLK
ncbi:Hypothetical predicted protein, partial [Paramuricea clavata]